MTIEAGALALRISEMGGDQVLRTLTAIDAKARALGMATQSVKFNTSSLTGVSGQLQQVGTQFQNIANAANRAAPAVDKATQATAKAGATSKAAAAQLGEQLLGYYSLQQVVSTAARIFDEFNAAADRQTIAQQKLSATSRLAGVSLGTITTISDDAQRKFALSSGAAADLTQGFVKLAGRAGNVAQTGQLMSAWMDLAKAQGLSLSDIMTGVNTTLVGQDEGLNRLGLLNPSNIWKQWADAAGTTVAKMTEQQKWLSIINAVLAEGEKVRGEYAKFLDTVPGKQEAWNAGLEKFNAHVGSAGGGVRSMAYDVGTTLVNAFVNADQWIDRVAAKTSTWFRNLVGLGPSPLAEKLKSVDPLAQDAHLASSIQAANQLAAQQKADKEARERAAREAARAEAERERKRLAREREAAIRKAMETPTLGFQELATTSTIPTADPRLTPTVGVDSKGRMQGVKESDLAKSTDGLTRLGKEWDQHAADLQAKKDLMTGILTSAGSAVATAFGDAFSAAFRGDDNFFAALGKALLASLGNILVQLGASMVEYALLAQVLTFVPGPWQALGLGAIATGAVGMGLMALGAGMGALASGGKGKGGGAGGGKGAKPATEEDNEFAVAFDPDRKLRGSSGSAVAQSTRPLDSAPMPDARPVVQIGTINSLSPDSQAWQRAVADTYMNARGRGLIRNG